jgi:hypothetical protein
MTEELYYKFYMRGGCGSTESFITFSSPIKRKMYPRNPKSDTWFFDQEMDEKHSDIVGKAREKVWFDKEINNKKWENLRKKDKKKCQKKLEKYIIYKGDKYDNIETCLIRNNNPHKYNVHIIFNDRWMGSDAYNEERYGLYFADTDIHGFLHIFPDIWLEFFFLPYHDTPHTNGVGEDEMLAGGQWWSSDENKTDRLLIIPAMRMISYPSDRDKTTFEKFFGENQRFTKANVSEKISLQNSSDEESDD